MPYHDFVKKYQIDYLGLKQTFFGEDLAKVKQEDVTLTGNVHQTFKKNKDYPRKRLPDMWKKRVALSPHRLSARRQ